MTKSISNATTITIGSRWGEVDASAGLRLVRVLRVDDFAAGFVTVEIIRDRHGSHPRGRRISRIRTRSFLRRYRPVEAR